MFRLEHEPDDTAGWRPHLLAAARTKSLVVVRTALERMYRASAHAAERQKAIDEAFLKLFEGPNPNLDVELASLFVENGANVNGSDENGRTLLMMCYDASVAELLIKHGADVNAVATTVGGRTMSALQVAMQQHFSPLIKVLIRHGAVVNDCDLVLAASWTRDLELVGILVDAVKDVNTRDMEGDTALMVCTCPEVAQFLLQRGADVNAVCMKGTQKTVLMRTLQHANNRMTRLSANRTEKTEHYYRLKHVLLMTTDLEIVSTLINAGAQVNAQDKVGRTALMMCTNPDVAKLLIANGAQLDVVSRDQSENTVLQSALTHSEAVAKVLILHGAKARSKDLFLLLSEHYNPEPYLIKLLLDAGACVNERNENGETPLMLCRTTEVAEILIQNGADVNATVCGRENSTALSSALNEMKFPLARTLLRNGAKARETDMTCHGLQREGQELAALLLSAGASVNAHGKDGTTPLMLNGTLDMVDYLLRNGADPNGVIMSCHNINNGDTVLMDRIVHETPRHMVDIVQRLLEAGADVRTVNRTTKKSAVSVLLNRIRYCGFTKNRLTLLRMILEHGGRLTHESQNVFAMAIVESNLEALKLLISAGAGPAAFDNGRIMLGNMTSRNVQNLKVTPFCLALVSPSRVHIAEYLASVSFLTTSDLFNLPRILHDQLRGRHSRLFLADWSSRPRGLFEIAFVAVSTALGPAPGREERVKATGLPPSLQRKLLFITHAALDSTHRDTF